MHDGKPPVLEFVAIKRKDTGTWAIPSHVSLWIISCEIGQAGNIKHILCVWKTN